MGIITSRRYARIISSDRTDIFKFNVNGLLLADQINGIKLSICIFEINFLNQSFFKRQASAGLSTFVETLAKNVFKIGVRS